jgi:RNA polymerase sigma-70 factor (ECF subfamily)
METTNLSLLLQKIGPELFPFALSLTNGDSDAAKDLSQETIFRALTHADKFETGTNLKAWLFTIMRNIFINDYRKKNREKTVVEKVPHHLLSDIPKLSVFSQQEMKITIKEILNFIYHLPDAIRAPFMLYCDGFKYREIAVLMDEPLGTIKSRIHFARKSLQDQLPEYGY